MNKIITSLSTCLLGAASVFATQPNSNLTAGEALQKADKQFFIENKGQWHSDVLFLTRMGGLDVWITKYGVNYTFYQIEKKPNAEKAERLPSKFENDLEDATLLGHRVLLKLQNHNANPLPQGKIKQQGYYNYLIGNDPSKHATYVGLYKEAVVKNVYNGIDLRYYFENGYLRYDFVVQPGADPSQIKFELDGEFKEYLKNNTLCYTTCFGEVQMQNLYVYQQVDKKQVPAKFIQQNGLWQFQLNAYDKTQPLIIDPLIYSTYIGGSSDDCGNSIAIDGSGNAYITGWTNSTDYDITPGAFQTTNGGSWDVFVTKLNSTGTGLIYSTYIGGSSTDYGYGIAIDGSGNAYITGRTISTDYDITSGAFQTTYGGGNWDVFVTKLNSTGTGLIYSTYIGGSSGDIGYDIAIDGSGNAYITGWTNSTDYDITPGAFQTTNGGNYDVFVTKLNNTGTDLIYSTYIGGSGWNESYGIAIDGSGNAYITGYTLSTNYDITPGAFQTSNAGNRDVFVTKLNSTGTGLIYSTYIGGSGDDYGYAIAIDGSGNAYITGQTNSTDYDITPGAFQTSNAGNLDVFVTKLSLCASPSQPGPISGNNNVCAGTTQTYSVAPVSGASSYTWTLPSGWTGSSTTNSINATVGANSGNITVTANNACGSSSATTLAVVVNSSSPAQPSAITGNTIVCQNSTETYSVNPVSGATSYTWTLPSGWTGNSTTNSITATVGANGGNISVTADNGCGSSPSQTINVTVNPIPNVTVTNVSGTLIVNQSGATYQWIDCNNNNAPISGAINQSFTPTTGGSYAVVVTLNGCVDTSACQTVTIAGIDTEALSKQVFSIYPNPNQGNFTIQSTKGGVFELIDVKGKVIHTYTITNTQQTVNENIPAGMYFVREKESGSVQKVIIE
jgi:hypothetical protein